MIDDLDGAKVVDATGEQIGTVERSYVDDGGAVQLVAVKLGTLFAKHRLVPVEGAGRGDGVLTIPYAKQLVEDAPEADGEDELDSTILERVRAHYPRDRVSLRDLRDRDAASTSAAERAPIDERPADRENRAGPALASAAGSEDAATPASGIRDLGDVIEVPIVEEELVKVPVVKEVLRIRKESVTRPTRVTETLRREELDVQSDGDVEVRREDGRPA